MDALVPSALIGFEESMAAAGYLPLSMSPEQVTRRMQADCANLAKAVKLMQ